MNENLIKSLVEQHRPIRPFDARQGWIIAASIVAASALFCHFLFGFRGDVLAGIPDDIVILRAAILLVLGIAAVSATASMARPGVGNQADGWLWAGLIAAVFPVGALLTALAGQFSPAIITASSGIRCLFASITIGLVIATGLVLWLRSAAPVRPERLGWSVGVASGSLATLAYSLSCPSNSVAYAGFWYSLAVSGTAVLCRLAVPRLVRW